MEAFKPIKKYTFLGKPIFSDNEYLLIESFEDRVRLAQEFFNAKQINYAYQASNGKTVYSENIISIVYEYIDTVNEAARDFKEQLKGSPNYSTIVAIVLNPIDGVIKLENSEFLDYSFKLGPSSPIEVSINFSDFIFGGACKTSNAEFKGNMIFNGCTFAKGVWFPSCHFYAWTNFNNCVFNSKVVFDECYFAGSFGAPEFKNSKFEERVTFRSAVFKHSAPDFSRSTFNGRLDFKECCIAAINTTNEYTQLKNIQQILISQNDEEMAQRVHAWELEIKSNIIRQRLADELFKKPLRKIRKYLPFLKKPKTKNLIISFDPYYEEDTLSRKFRRKRWLTQKLWLIDDVWILILSKAYKILNNRGSSILLPFLWLLIFTLLMPFYYKDHIINAPAENNRRTNFIQSVYEGNEISDIWQNKLRAEHSFTQAQFYSAQTSLWPTKFASSTQVLELTSIKAKIISIIHSALATFLLYLIIVGIRRKFKMEGL